MLDDSDLHDHAPLSEEFLTALRAPVTARAGFDARVMAEVRQYAPGRHFRRSWSGVSLQTWQTWAWGSAVLAAGIAVVITVARARKAERYPAPARTRVAITTTTQAPSVVPQHEVTSSETSAPPLPPKTVASAPGASVIPHTVAAPQVAAQSVVAVKTDSESAAVRIQQAPPSPVYATTPHGGQNASPLEGRVSLPVRVAVDHLVDSLHAIGVPTSLVVDKALEGATKGAEDERILTAVRRVATDLVTAHHALPGATDAELTAAVSTLQAGVPASTVRELWRALPGRPLIVPLSVLGLLVRQGVPERSAVSAVVTAASRVDDRNLAEFGKAVGRDIAAGLSPIVAVQQAGGVTATGQSAQVHAQPVRP